MTMNTVELIERKRDGGALTADEIRWLIASYVDGSVPDYQMSAMLMAVFQQGLDPAELAAWTDAMLHSGSTLSLDDIDAPKIDKHSTGGVGDKVSIVLAPMVAACGVAIPMMSGRGLGHTGGTLDKLESIPGFTTQLDPDRFLSILRSVGMVLAGQSETMVPADREMYALRDATGTVPSIPLIASSIMSKKLSEDLDGLVLDVKVGNGAFMKGIDQARQLARTMVEIGSRSGTRTVALLTSMDQPLGNAVGNTNEVRESIAALRGDGPPDLTDLTMALGAEMLILAGVSGSEANAHARLREAIASGAALQKFRDVVVAQDGDPAVTDDPTLLADAPYAFDLLAKSTGTVRRCDALDIGMAAMRLGAGRVHKEASIDATVGIEVAAKVGDQVDTGGLLATVHYREDGRLADAMPFLEAAWEIGEATEPPKLVLDRIDAP